MYWAFPILFYIGTWLLDFWFVVSLVLSRFSLSNICVLWRLFSGRGFCQMCYFAPTNWETPARNTKTPVFIICKLYLWKGDSSGTHIYFFSSFDSQFLSFQMYGAFSKLFRIGIWLFDFSFVVFFVLSRFWWSVIGVLWRPRSRPRSCQVG